jgi:HAD superfamily phosphoserine phosphatase-like hydrolase
VEGIYMRRLLICFDVDGTLIDDTIFIWQTLHDKMKTDPVERKFWSDAYWNHQITYEEWATRDVEMWIRQNVTREILLESLADLQLMSGARYTLSQLRKNDHALGVISGSIDLALEKTIPDYSSVFDFVFLNRLLFDENNKLTGIVPTPFDIEQKASGLIEMSNRLRIPLRDTVFVGDNFNDIEVAKIAGCSIAFNCKSDELREVCRSYVAGNDLTGILPVIEKFASEE